MRDTLPNIIWKNEIGTVNLDSTEGPGMHWVCFCKFGKKVIYFDSFGNLRPPVEISDYFLTSAQRPVDIIYNYDSHQNMNTVNCGHLCLLFLSSEWQ